MSTDGQHHIPTDLRPNEVIVHAEDLVTVAPSFADELCKEILVTRCAMRLTVEGASEKLAYYLERSAKARGASNRLIIRGSTDRPTPLHTAM
jgi:hypothetical protein